MTIRNVSATMLVAWFLAAAPGLRAQDCSVQASFTMKLKDTNVTLVGSQTWVVKGKDGQSTDLEFDLITMGAGPGSMLGLFTSRRISMKY